MVWVLKRKEMDRRRSVSQRGRKWMGGGVGPKEGGDGWEEVWDLKRKEMDGRRSGS